MAYKSKNKEQELSIEEAQLQRDREQALMEEFIRTKGVTKLPPDERLAAYSGRASQHRPTLNGRRIIQHVASIEEGAI